MHKRYFYNGEVFLELELHLECVSEKLNYSNGNYTFTRSDGLTKQDPNPPEMSPAKIFFDKLASPVGHNFCLTGSYL
jgi:hypothetical protein